MMPTISPLKGFVPVSPPSPTGLPSFYSLFHFYAYSLSLSYHEVHLMSLIVLFEVLTYLISYLLFPVGLIIHSFLCFLPYRLFVLLTWESTDVGLCIHFP